MQSATRGIFFVFSFILLVIGLVDVVQQLKLDEEFQWRVPLIFFGFGAGIPTVLFLNPDLFRPESDTSMGHDSSDDHGSYGGDGGSE